VIGGLRFYERLEIRDALAYMRVTLQPKDDLAFERIINTPKRGVGNAALSTIFKTARHYNLSLYEALLKLLATDELQSKVKNALRDLTDKFAHWQSLLSSLKPPELAELILEQSGYLDMWRQDKTLEAQGRSENLKELITAIAEFGSLQEFAEHVALVMETQNNTHDDMLTIMTLHGAKGLEFETVFLPGFEEGLFPSQRTLDENGQNGLEEERRLAYVGLTRAKKRIFISYVANRLIYGSWTQTAPSRFIAELPPELLERSSEYGLSSPMQSPSRGPHHFYGGQKSFVIETDSTRLESESGFAPKDRVFHQKFGYGIVIAVDHDKLDIAFEKAGRKKIMESFVAKA
jgi:DNA helicase-2/ATP-dependent DNA helicase PcrA